MSRKVEIDGELIGIEDHLIKISDRFVTRELENGCIPNTHNIDDYLDSWLLKFEQQNGEILSGIHYSF